MTTAINPEDTSDESKQEMAGLVIENAETVVIEPQMSLTDSLQSDSGFILAYHKTGQGESPYYIVGTQSNPFREERWGQGVFVTQIEAWVMSDHISAIQLGFSDGNSARYGRDPQIEGKYFGSISIDYANGERVTDLSVWTDAKGGIPLGFEIKTNKNTFFPKITNESRVKRKFTFNAGGGIILGVIGYAGWVVEGLGFEMLDTVSACVLTDIDYHKDKVKGEVIESRSLDPMDVPNPTDEDMDGGDYVCKETLVSGGEWYITVGFKYGAELSVEAGIPLVVTAKGSAHWEISAEGSYKETWSHSDEKSKSVRLLVPKRSKWRYIFYYEHGTIDAYPYDATVKCYLVNGGIWTYKVSGIYKGTSVSGLMVNCFPVATWDGSNWHDVPEPPKVLDVLDEQKETVE
jgi:hypothetical protein